MTTFLKALWMRDDVMAGLALGALAAGFFYWAWPSSYPDGWKGDK